MPVRFCVRGLQEIRRRWEMKAREQRQHRRQGGQQVDGAAEVTLQTPAVEMEVYVSLRGQVMAGRPEHCPCDFCAGLCPLPFPQPWRLRFVPMLRALPASSPHRPIPSPFPQSHLQGSSGVLVSHSTSAVSFGSHVEMRFSADSDVFIYLATDLLKE